MPRMQTIILRHNMEVAHRLHLLEGKCENIHGHSMWVELHITGRVDSNGVLLSFSDVKKRMRDFLDTNFDHHLLLHEEDPLVQEHSLPGIMLFDNDPTTENLAMWIGAWAELEFGTDYDYKIVVHETNTNAGVWESY